MWGVWGIGVSKAQPPDLQLPPDIQKLMEKAKSGQGLSLAEIARIQKAAQELQKRAMQHAGNPGEGKPPTGASNTQRTGPAAEIKCTVNIGYRMTISKKIEGSTCDDKSPDSWTSFTNIGGHFSVGGTFTHLKPGNAQGDELFQVHLDGKGSGSGSSLATGTGHKGDRANNNWSASQIQGMISFRSFASRGDRMTGEALLAPQGSTRMVGTSCKGESKTTTVASPEGISYIALLMQSFAREQLINPAGLEIAQNMGIQIPPSKLAEIRKQGEQAYAVWQKEHLCDFSISLKEFQKGLESHQPFQVVGTSQFDKTADDGARSSGRLTVSVRVGEVPPLELVVRPQNYDAWMPEGGNNEENAGNTLQIQASVQTKDHKAPPTFIKLDHARFDLLESSKEPGVCLNLPLTDAQSTPDLKFEGDNNPGADVTDKSVELQQPDNRFSATLSSFDWGGWGKFKVTATLDDGEELTGYLDGNKGMTEIMVPKHSADSKIATTFGAQGSDMADDDTQTDNPNKGDGLTVYEEYRGFMAKGKHQRLSPDHKDLLIENKVGDEVSGGFSLFEHASGIHVVELASGELPQDRVVNLNKGYANGGVQHGLRVMRDAANSNGTVATANHVSGKEVIPSSPAKCIYIGIACSGAGAASATIAHEIAHACGVKHHGDKEAGFLPGNFERVPIPTVPGTPEPPKFGGSDGPPTPQPCNSSASADAAPAGDSDPPGTSILTITADDKNVRIFGGDGKEITERPYKMKREIGIVHGKSSGDDNCLMFYESWYQWAMHKDGDQITFWALNPHPPGTTFCRDNKGKGINAPGNKPTNYFGDAENGGCIKQFKVKDW